MWSETNFQEKKCLGRLPEFLIISFGLSYCLPIDILRFLLILIKSSFAYDSVFEDGGVKKTTSNLRQCGTVRIIKQELLVLFSRKRWIFLICGKRPTKRLGCYLRTCVCFGRYTRAMFDYVCNLEAHSTNFPLTYFWWILFPALKGPTDVTDVKLKAFTAIIASSVFHSWMQNLEQIKVFAKENSQNIITRHCYWNHS